MTAERLMQQHWQQALDDIQKQLSQESFEAWFLPIECGELDAGTLRVKIPNRFYADWISKHYLHLLLDSLRDHTGMSELDLHFEVDEALAQAQKEAQQKEAQQTPEAATGGADAAPSSIALRRPDASVVVQDAPQTVTNLNPKYRFENFVVGPSNQLAHAASIAAGGNPGSRYNPLFIYGGVGLGKTHLVNAVGHRVLEKNPNARILYVSAERFTNEFIWALQNNRINEFRNRYRTQCDVLLMDDIQFLASREQTQEEFFHTFNALYHSDKQIVVSSDVYPQQIGKMEERLISRFQWGMVADVQAPELDTRVAIVCKKAEQEGIQLSTEVAHYLAQVVRSNVRELEGTLLRLAVKAELLHREIDLEFAKETLRSTMPQPESVSTVEDIQRAVCDYFSIRLHDLKSTKRKRSVAQPRMIAMYLCRQRLRASYAELGDRFGGKDHTTVMSAVKKIERQLLQDDPDIVHSIEAIELKLGRS